MTAAASYRAYLHSQGLSRLETATDAYPFLVGKLDEELPETSEVTFFRQAGRTSRLHCVFWLPESPYYYRFIVQEWDDTDTRARLIHVSSTMPKVDGSLVPLLGHIIGETLRSPNQFHSAIVQSFAELKQWTHVRKTTPDVTDAAPVWCSIV